MNLDSPRIPRQIGELRLVENPRELDWLPVVAHQGGGTGAFVPRGFDSGVLILDALESKRLGRDLQWSDLTRTIAAYGRPSGVEAVVAHNDLDNAQAGYVLEQMRAETLEVIEGVMASCFPDTSRCFYALWMMDTYFEARDDAFAYNMSDIRRCYVYEGPLGGWRPLWPDILPSLWWSTGREWCMTRDVDIHWSFLAGPPILTQQLLASDLPCVPVEWDEPL